MDIRGPVRGVVVDWHSDRGWGILRSPEAPADVWCHFSAIRQAAGYRELAAGEPVSFTFEPVEQDGYHYVADEVRRDGSPGDAEGEADPGPGDRAAYQSRRTLARPGR